MHRPAVEIEAWVARRRNMVRPARDMARYEGRKLVVITGATSGIGLATATELGRRGHRPVVVGKTHGDVERAVSLVETATGVGVPGEVADLSCPADVDDLAMRLGRRFTRIDALVNNAGVLLETLERTPEGHERTWATNVLGPFRLTARLLPQLTRSGSARVINVASTAHRNADADFRLGTVQARDPGAFDGFLAYARSKLALIVLTRKLAARYPPRRVVVHSLHPGIVATSLPAGPGRVSDWMRFGSPVLLSPRRGAVTPVYLTTSSDPAITWISGQHWWGRRIVTPSRLARDPELADRIWDLVTSQTGMLIDESSRSPSK